MKTVYRWMYVVILAALVLAACNSTPSSTPPASVPNPTGTPVTSYPATKSGEQAATAVQPTSYPAPLPIPTSQAAPETGYPATGNLQVTKSDGSISSLTFDALKALAATKVTLEGKEENVRKLADVLNLAGATTFSKVTVTSSNGSIVLTKDQVAQAYLDIPNDGNIRLMIQGISKDRWPSAVISLKIE
jgi:hypothetical protein